VAGNGCRSTIMRKHVLAQDLVDSELILATLSSEPARHIWIKLHSELGLLGGNSEDSSLEKAIGEWWNVRVVDLVIRH
jgi:hypothetical protein